MPTYEYVCQSCGTHVEVYQRFSDEPLTECGVCGGPLRKVFHPAGILFKGSGFYSTDSRAKARTGAKGKSEKSESSSSEASGASGGSSKSSETTSKTSSSEKASPGTKEKSA